MPVWKMSSGIESWSLSQQTTLPSDSAYGPDGI